jgi:hypothetical protein
MRKNVGKQKVYRYEIFLYDKDLCTESVSAVNISDKIRPNILDRAETMRRQE